MKYSRKDLRAVDMFSLVLTGAGVLFLVLGGIGYLTTERAPQTNNARIESKKEDEPSNPRINEKVDGKSRHATPGLSQIFLGVVFASLGIALNLGLRRVLKNNLEDVVEPHDDEEVQRSSAD